jgi:hypothetical protein
MFAKRNIVHHMNVTDKLLESTQKGFSKNLMAQLPE